MFLFFSLHVSVWFVLVVLLYLTGGCESHQPTGTNQSSNITVWLCATWAAVKYSMQCWWSLLSDRVIHQTSNTVWAAMLGQYLIKADHVVWAQHTVWNLCLSQSTAEPNLLEESTPRVTWDAALICSCSLTPGVITFELLGQKTVKIFTPVHQADCSSSSSRWPPLWRSWRGNVPDFMNLTFLRGERERENQTVLDERWDQWVNSKVFSRDI